MEVGGRCHAPADFIPGKDPVPIVQEIGNPHKTHQNYKILNLNLVKANIYI